MKKSLVYQETLLQELNRKGKMTLAEVVELLQVSESTARRLIVNMENNELLLRCFGGVQKLPQNVAEYSYDIAKTQNDEEKAAIGAYAAGLVQSGEMIFLSAGSTVCHLAIALQQRIENKELKDLTVITNSTEVLNLLAAYCTVIIIGGIYRQKSNDVIGIMAEKNIASMHYTKAFLGADSVDLKEGAMTSDIEINGVMEIAKGRSENVFLLADSSKFDKTAFVYYAALNEFAGIITDAGLSVEIVEKYKAEGAEVMCAD